LKVKFQKIQVRNLKNMGLLVRRKATEQPWKPVHQTSIQLSLLYIPKSDGAPPPAAAVGAAAPPNSDEEVVVVVCCCGAPNIGVVDEGGANRKFHF
jgi:hypothetical protein